MRYEVTPVGGTLNHPWCVFDTKGGWVCSRHKTQEAAEVRAKLLNDGEK